MAVDAPDYILTIDRDGSGVVKRTLVLQEEHPLVTSQWSGLRGAAAQSLSALVSWLQSNDSAGHAWFTSKSSTDQEGLRQAILSGS